MRNLNYLDYYPKKSDKHIREKMIAIISDDSVTDLFMETNDVIGDLLKLYNAKIVKYFERVNEEIEVRKVVPLFPDVKDIKTREDRHDVLVRRDELTETRTLEERNEYFGCELYEAYQPPKFEPKSEKDE